MEVLVVAGPISGDLLPNLFMGHVSPSFLWIVNFLGIISEIFLINNHNKSFGFADLLFFPRYGNDRYFLGL